MGDEAIPTDAGISFDFIDMKRTQKRPIADLRLDGPGTRNSKLGPRDSKLEARNSTIRSQFPFAPTGGMVYAGTGEESMHQCGIVVLAGPHMLATCRGGEDRERSVVDFYGQSHEIRNLGWWMAAPCPAP
jgi:choline dehydrogenase-like flavoprotein